MLFNLDNQRAVTRYLIKVRLRVRLQIPLPGPRKREFLLAFQEMTKRS
jgi:hypothetical protein